ncbi:YtxH domain-containing protein [Klebsiella oxytoca]|uniref:YtxH domain-containing protein n=1 Tax=Klebsiella oxytoca TaxID=571 RepID=UPI00384B834D
MKTLLLVSLIFITGAALGCGAALHFAPQPHTTREQCSELMTEAAGSSLRQGAAWAAEKLNHLAGKE